MDSSTLDDLIARLEASGPDRELDGAIAVAIDGFWTVPGCEGALDYCFRDERGGEVHPGHGGLQLVRPYTVSLDAALALVERALGGDRSRAWRILEEVVEELPVRGWRPSKPLGPQLAIALILALLRSIQPEGKDHGR